MKTGVPQPAVDPVRADLGAVLHPDDDLRHGLGRALPRGGARHALLDGGDALGSVPFGWIIGCPLLGWLSDRLGRRKPVIVGAGVVLAGTLR
jgi:MFS family permease